METKLTQVRQRHFKRNFFIALFIIVAVIGFADVKWWPYLQKAIVASNTHSIGKALIAGVGKHAAAPSIQAGLIYCRVYFKAVWKAAVLGILIGSLVQVLIPTRWIYKTFGGTKFSNTVIAALCGVPTMMCTCCTAPVAAGLHKAKASINSVTSFFLANPLLNPATLIFMGFVLGWRFVTLRIVLGIVAVLGIATLIGKMSSQNQVSVPANISFDPGKMAPGKLMVKWLKALGILTLETVPAYLIIVFLLGVFQGTLFPVISQHLSTGIMAVVFFAITGTLFVIPTAAEVPIIQTLMALGMGGGPAGTLLLTLPAVSIVSLALVKSVYTWKELLAIFGSVVGVGLVAGLCGAIFL